MEALGLTAEELRAAGGYLTACEIAQQPQLWPEVLQLVAGDAALAGFLAPLLADRSLRIVLTGAGTSSFLGECLAPALVRVRARPAEAIASTDIVASPGSLLMPDAPTLMVHFARSGGSPESVAALEFGGQRIKRCAHLIVTCNAEGELCRRAAGLPGAHTLLLPPASNDQGFAMTSSFTGMLLAAGLALRVMPAEATRVTRLAELGRRIMSEFLPLLSELAHAGFERVVYLGSGELKGLAHEAALKMLELTDGQVVSTGDSPLAFRHGPKAILNAATLAVVFLSNDAYTRRYELDLVAELRRERIAGRVIALADRADVPGHRDTLVLGETHTAPADALTDLGLCLPYVMFAQALALLRSLSLGLSPDNPNATGTVHRVVKGVSIYPYGGER